MCYNIFLNVTYKSVERATARDGPYGSCLIMDSLQLYLLEGGTACYVSFIWVRLISQFQRSMHLLKDQYREWSFLKAMK